MKKIFVVGPGASKFTKKGEAPSLATAIKFCVLKVRNEISLLIFVEEAPLKYHADAVQFFLGKTILNSVVVCGGRQMIFDQKNKIIHVFEISALGCPMRDKVKACLHEGWPDYKVSFSDQEETQEKETEIGIDFDKFNKMKSNLPEDNVFKELS